MADTFRGQPVLLGALATTAGVAVDETTRQFLSAFQVVFEVASRSFQVGVLPGSNPYRDLERGQVLPGSFYRGLATRWKKTASGN
jgi:hypothetical protein